MQCFNNIQSYDNVQCDVSIFNVTVMSSHKVMSSDVHYLIRHSAISLHTLVWFSPAVNRIVPQSFFSGTKLLWRCLRLWIPSWLFDRLLTIALPAQSHPTPTSIMWMTSLSQKLHKWSSWTLKIDRKLALAFPNEFNYWLALLYPKLANE